MNNNHIQTARLTVGEWRLDLAPAVYALSRNDENRIFLADEVLTVYRRPESGCSSCFIAGGR